MCNHGRRRLFLDSSVPIDPSAKKPTSKLPMTLKDGPAAPCARLACVGAFLPLVALNIFLALALSGYYYSCRLAPPPFARAAVDASRLEGAASAAAGADGLAGAPLGAGKSVAAEGKRIYPALPTCRSRGGRKRAKSWLMVFMGHSGSTAIVSELKQHSEVFFELPEPVDHGRYETNGTAALEYVRAFFQRGVDAGRSPGFKIRPRHLLSAEPGMREKWMALLREFDTRIIWQYRENIFKQAVGEYSHRYLNDSSVVEGLRNGMTREERCKTGVGCHFRVDNFDYLQTLLQDAVHSDALISRAVEAATDDGKETDCTLSLPYEAYLYDRSAVMARLHDFLGLRPEDHLADRAKATSDSMCDAVENYGDLCREFYGCHGWRSLMDDYKNNCYCGMYTSRAGKTTRCRDGV